MIEFKSVCGSNCASSIGPRSDRTDSPLSLGNGCFSMGVVQHEMMHSLGFGHEQQRPDRDDKVQNST